MNHASAKHYRIAQAYIRCNNERKVVETVEVNTHDNGADMFTKSLGRDLFHKHRLKVMGSQMPPSNVQGKRSHVVDTK